MKKKKILMPLEAPPVYPVVSKPKKKTGKK